MAFMSGNPYYSGPSGAAQGVENFTKNFMSTYLALSERERENLKQKMQQQKIDAEIRQSEIQNDLYKQQTAVSVSEEARKQGEYTNLLGARTAVKAQKPRYTGEAPETIPSYDPEDTAKIISHFYPERALELRQQAMAVKHTGATTRKIEEVDIPKGGVEIKTELTKAPLNVSEMEKNYALAAKALQQEPTLNAFKTDQLNFLAGKGFSNLKDPLINAAATKYLESPEGIDSWNRFLDWKFSSEQRFEGPGGQMMVSKRPPNPNIGAPPAPGAPSGVPQVPQAPSVAPPQGEGRVRKLVDAKGEQIKFRLTPEMSDNMSMVGNIKDTFNLFSTVQEKYGKETGPAQKAYHETLGKYLPGAPMNMAYKALENTTAPLYDIVYLKSGKQINESELDMLKRYVPRAGQKPEEMASNKHLFEYHLNSIILNRATNYAQNGYEIPKNIQRHIDEANKFMSKNKLKPLAGFGLKDAENYKPLGMQQAPQPTAPVGSGWYQEK